jgi:hypothetical protein
VPPSPILAGPGRHFVAFAVVFMLR